MKIFKLILVIVAFVSGTTLTVAQDQGATSKKGSVSAPAKLPSAPTEPPAKGKGHYGQVPAAKPAYTAPATGNGYSKMPEAPANRQLNRTQAVSSGLNYMVN